MKKKSANNSHLRPFNATEHNLGSFCLHFSEKTPRKFGCCCFSTKKKHNENTKTFYVNISNKQ